MIRLHMALPGVGLAIDVAPEHIVVVIPCNEGGGFDAEAKGHPGARCVLCMSDGSGIYVTETRDEVGELCRSN